MSLLSFLSPALTVATQAAGARERGQAQGRKEAHATMMEKLAQMRQEALDKQNAAMQQAQIDNLKSLDFERRNPSTVGPGYGVRNSTGGYDIAVPPKTTPDEPQIVKGLKGAGGGRVTQGLSRDGRVVWERPESDEPTLGQSLAQQQREFGNKNRLRDDYANEPNIKRGKDYASAYQGVIAASREDNPQSNLAMMYEAVKMRDPNAVREGELALQLRARGVPQWVMGMWNKAAKGNILLPEERQQIVQWAEQKLIEQNELIKPIQAEYGAQIRGMGQASDSSFVAPSPFRGIPRFDKPKNSGPPHREY